MAKYILVSMAALMLAAAPAAVMAQTSNESNPGSSQPMKGPPNANGMKTDPSDSMNSGRSESNGSGSSNGAASATSTGADKH